MEGDIGMGGDMLYVNLFYFLNLRVGGGEPSIPGKGRAGAEKKGSR